MKGQFIISGLVAGVIMLGFIPGVRAASIQRDINLNQTSGPSGITSMDLSQLNPGDQILLNLINTSGMPLTFHTTQYLGSEDQWVVPANTTLSVTFLDQPLNSAVNYVIIQPNGNQIASGMFMNANAERPTAYQPDTTPTAPPPTATPMLNTSPAPVPAKRNVRGYW